MDIDERVRAFEKIAEGDEACIKAVWRSFPSPFEIDCRDQKAVRRLLKKIALAALYSP